MHTDPQVSDHGRFLVVEAESRLQMNRRKMSVYDLGSDAPARELASGALEDARASLSPDGRRPAAGFDGGRMPTAMEPGRA